MPPGSPTGRQAQTDEWEGRPVRFAFVYAEAEVGETPPAEQHLALPQTYGPPTRPILLPSVLISRTAHQINKPALQNCDRTHAILNRFQRIVVNMRTRLQPALELDQVDSDEMFRPQAFRAPARGGRS